jgi:hypothetical protein
MSPGSSSALRVLAPQRAPLPAGGAIASLVLQREPALASLATLVHLVCERPWQIRRPRDLAAACGHSVRTVRRQVARVGFLRVEHFLTCVRHVALEQLSACLHLTLPQARRLVGIADRANARRQLRRARRSTPAEGLRRVTDPGSSHPRSSAPGWPDSWPRTRTLSH